MARKCKCKCGVELLPASKCEDIITKKGYASVECLTAHTRAKQAEKEQKAIKKRNLEFKKSVSDNDRSAWAKKAQTAFNSYIRARDEKDPCISCQRHHTGQYHAGHYRTVGGHPELRFDEINCHKQCSVCNNHMSGNIADYRINLVKKIGLDNVEWIEGPHNPKKYSIEDLKEITAKYKAKIK